MAGAVALASTGLHTAIDEAWAGHVGSAGRPGSPQREPALPTETAREQSTPRRKVESSFWSGGWIAAQLRPPGTGCSPANGTLRSLTTARPCVLSIALPLRFYYDLPKRPQNLWVLTHRT